MTVIQALQAIRRRLDEESTMNTHWSNERLMSYLTEAVGDAVMRVPPSMQPELSDTYSTFLPPNNTSISFTADHVLIYAVEVDERNAERYDISQQNMLTDNLTKIPSNQYPAYSQFGSTIKILPLSYTTREVKVYYLGIPTPITSLLSTIPLPAFVHPWLIPYAVYIALLEDGDQVNLAIAEKLYAEYTSKFERFANPKAGGG